MDTDSTEGRRAARRLVAAMKFQKRALRMLDACMQVYLDDLRAET